MTAQQVAVKRYIVKLSAEEREQLNTLIRTGKHRARQLMKARILLKADVSEAGEGWSDSHIASVLGHHRQHGCADPPATGGGRVRSGVDPQAFASLGQRGMIFHSKGFEQLRLTTTNDSPTFATRWSESPKPLILRG